MGEPYDEARAAALDLLLEAATPYGFVASPAYEHYRSIWTRDAAVAVLAVPEDERLRAAARATIETLAARTGRHGQIPDAVWPERGHWDWGEGGATDASAWFVIAAARVADWEGPRWLERLWPAIEGAVDWLRRQDTTGTGVIDSPPAGDWMDSSLMRSGRVFHVNLLFWWAARAHGELARTVGTAPLVEIEETRRRIDRLFWPRPGLAIGDVLGMPGYAHSASVEAYRRASERRRWFVSHIAHAAFVDRCDVLANLLAVFSGFVDGERRDVVLDVLAPAADPYPSRSWLRPFAPGDDPWGVWNRAAEIVIPRQWRNPPHEYHNAGVWPYIGGLHVAALARAQRRGEARLVLDRLVEANRLAGDGEWGFHEWLHGATGEPRGARAQTWNAAALLLALEAVGGDG